ncbi:MAG: hypothetical protein IGR80_00050 [Synechococcales cyanobacterium K44_A2020_017]|nr:hypothetical protein [Synechococcales cyanobacterium K44_A2020_017]
MWGRLAKERSPLLFISVARETKHLSPQAIVAISVNSLSLLTRNVIDYEVSFSLM